MPARKIGFDLSILDRTETGTSVYASNLFQALKDIDQTETEFVALRAPKPLPRKNLLTKFGNFFLEVMWLFVLLPVKARRQRLDLVHMPANAISPLLGVPQICSIHDAHFITNPEGRDPLWKLYAHWTFRFAARHADRILCDTNSAKDEIVRLLGADASNIEVVHLGLPHRDSSPQDAEAAVRLSPYILSVGATDPNKNLPALVSAFARLCHADAAFTHRLVLAGPPGRDHPRIIEQIRSENITGRVELLGRVSDSRLAALYENASLFVFPSFCEGFGFPPLEAMHAGVPVVASNAPCIPETLGEAAMYFNPHDVSEIVEGISGVLTDPGLRDRMIAEGQERSRMFTWEKTAHDTLAVYRSFLDSRSRRS